MLATFFKKNLSMFKNIRGDTLKINFPISLCLLIIVLVVTISGNAWAVVREPSFTFTRAEKDWLAENPVIIAAPDPDFPPVEYYDEDGLYRGMTADYIALIEKKLNIRFKIVRLKNWDEVLEKARTRQIHMITAATYTHQRKDYLQFTKPFMKLPLVIIVRQNVDKDLAMKDLVGMKVAVVYRYAIQDFLSDAYPEMDLDLVPDVQTGLRKVAFGMVDAMVANIATASYNIERENITNLRMAGESGFSYNLAFAPGKGNVELAAILEKGLSLISAEEQQQIYRKWITLQQDTLLQSKKFWISIAAGVSAVFLFAGGILFWNRTLRLRVEEKTAALKQEAIEHQLAKKAIEESETRYRSIIENTKNGVAVLKAVNDGDDFIFLDLNRSGESIDHLRREKVIGKSVLDIYPKLKDFGLFDLLGRVWKTGNPERHPVTLYTDNRISMWRETLVFKLPSGEIVVVYSDETELKALQEETLRSDHLASIGELASGVAHEINNPINSVINLAQILINESAGKSEENDIAERIIKESNRIADIVGSLLAFARERKDRKSLVSLNEIVTETLSLTAAQIRKDGIDLQIDIPGALPYIKAHMQQIQQVFLNIINNARYALNQKYPEGDKDKILSISAEFIKRNEDGWVRITFLDHGTGIPQRIVEQIMEPFFTTKPVGAGTGLGLSIGHGIISDHDGTLKIQSREGAYTRVLIDLKAGDKNDL